MATMTSSLPPILEPTPAIRAAVTTLKDAQQSLEDAGRSHGFLSRQYGEAHERLDDAWRALEKAIPCELGYYPIDGRLWGWSKTSRAGFNLTSKPASSDPRIKPKSGLRKIWY